MQVSSIDNELLLVDFKEKVDVHGIVAFLSASRVSPIHGVLSVQEAIDTLKPRAILFEYDYPELQGLRALLDVRRSFPEIPIVMITSYHSENLAVWAFRNRVWDYLARPLNKRDLTSRIDLLKTRDRQEVLPPQSRIPKEVRSYGKNRSRHTLPATNHIYANYAEKIELSTVAMLCGLRPIQFCKVFKRENGKTFQDFLVAYRIERASQLLVNTSFQITDVAYLVGFNDLSYFSRTFKRHMGLKPSAFQRGEYANLEASPLGEAPNNLAGSMKT